MQILTPSLICEKPANVFVKTYRASRWSNPTLTPEITCAYVAIEKMQPRPFDMRVNLNLYSNHEVIVLRTSEVHGTKNHFC